MPAVPDDGMRILALDVLAGLRPTCNDWKLEELPEIAKHAGEVSVVKTAIKNGDLCYDPDDYPCVVDQYGTFLTAEYFLPTERWRRDAIREAATRVKNKSMHVIIGMLRDYSADNINAYIKRNWADPYRRANIAWEKAYDWLSERNLEDRFKWTKTT